MRQLFNISKKMKLILFATLIIISLIVFGLWVIYNNQMSSPPPNLHSPYFQFEKENNTLVVVSINDHGSELTWENIELYYPSNNSGGATLPMGKINEGDKITNCSGTFGIVWKPHNVVLAQWDFK